MSNFCTNCGRSLAEGQICSCKERQGMDEVAFTTEDTGIIPNSGSKQQNDFKKYMNNMWSLSKMFIKNPVNTIITIARDGNYKVGLFFVAIQALIASLSIMILANQLFKSLFGLWGSFSLSEYGSTNVPYFSIFFKVFIGVFIQFFLLVGLIYFASKIIAKKSGSFKTLIASVGISSLPMTLSLAVSLLLGFIAPSITIYLIISGGLFSVILNYISLRESYDVPENKAVYIIPLSYFIYYFILMTIIFQSTKSSF